jgi:hypothetical protein
MNRSIPLADLTANSLSIQPEIDATIQRILDHTSCILGEDVAAFEAECPRYYEARYCVGVSDHGVNSLKISPRSRRRPLSATQHNPTTSLVGISFHCYET